MYLLDKQKPLGKAAFEFLSRKTFI